MARIAGIDLPKEKRAVIWLTYIYGIGRSSAQRILRESGVDESIKIGDLEEKQVNASRQFIGQHYRREGDLRT